VVGLLVLALGVGLLGWAGYQYLGTNVVAQRAFAEEKDGLRSQWEQEPPPPTARTSGTSTATPEPSPSRTVPGDAIALLRVPAFGSSYEVPIVSGTDLDTLSRGVGHYPSTALPGQIGNFAVAGHRVTHGQPFAKLLDLDPGDQVIVETRTAIYTYVIDEPPRALTVKPSDSWVLDPVPGERSATPTQALMTLTTCQDLFRSPDRSVGFAQLSSTKTKG
jgi:sortase A